MTPGGFQSSTFRDRNGMRSPASAPMPAPAPDADPLTDVGIDLASLLGEGSADVSTLEIDGGISGSGGVQMSAGVEASVSTPAGIPQVSAGVGGQFAAEGEFDTYGSYEDVDVSTDADAGTTDVSTEVIDGGASGEAGIEVGGEFGVDFQPVNGGIPEIGIEAGGEFGTYGGYDVHGGYEAIDAHRQSEDAYVG
ncbi:hypothetical protein O4328_29180 [Rhodococcus opacus]|uniref:Uncharacterized protein n=1 Tax=Rhodococcus opacus TaxID=37919 RepID=A0AAX3YT07_RHOOP|nr:hypothetical protein [Rhodococcus opacus]MCZ4587716.1 hypothetical protein [Rhodococcus opacus]WLF51289.1 hypothetical protein Q5707_38660 [Rhodococcus opacus]